MHYVIYIYKAVIKCTERGALLGFLGLKLLDRQGMIQLPTHWHWVPLDLVHKVLFQLI